jgi:hypothetical protein
MDLDDFSPMPKEREVLTLTGPTALRVAEAHRQVRNGLATVRACTLGLSLESGPLERVDRSRSHVSELLDRVVLPLADLEDEAIDLRHRHNSEAGRSATDRLEHDVVRELAATLRETHLSSRTDRDHLTGALHAVADLLPAHVDGEEHALLSQLTTVDVHEHARLRDVADHLPLPTPSPRPLARFHLAPGLELLAERLTDTAGGLLRPDGIEVRAHDASSRPVRRRIVPVAVIVDRRAIALRFTLDDEKEGETTTSAYLDAWLTATGPQRGCVLELHATSPPYRPERLPITTGEVRHAVATLGGYLAQGLHRDVRPIGLPGLDSARPQPADDPIPDLSRSEV